jgi:hypothetical protein
MSELGRYCCESRKSNDAENLAKVDFWALLLPQGSLGPIRRSVVVLVGNDVVPQVAAREAHQRSLKFSCFTRKILLQQYRSIANIGRRPDYVWFTAVKRTSQQTIISARPAARPFPLGSP